MSSVKERNLDMNKSRSSPKESVAISNSSCSNHSPSLLSSGREDPHKMELTFRNLEYFIPLSKKKRGKNEGKFKTIISNATGKLRPGRLTAILGATGAGKTTLLSLLAGNICTGTIKGQILVNGKLAKPRMLKEISGFVFQDDVFWPTMTIKETIKMSELLRVPRSVNDAERENRVANIVSVLDLESVQNSLIGSVEQRGISGGEKKRTSIAMEMVVNPPILFLDEPTTGLDSSTAFGVMLSLLQLAKMGRTVIATIHQPSTEIFELFDDLIILSRGRIAYSGPADKVADYFTRLGYTCPKYSNPIDYIFMEVLREFGSIEDGDMRLEASSDNHEQPNGSCEVDGNANMGSQSGANFSSTGRSTLLGNIDGYESLEKHCSERIEKVLTTWLHSPENEQLVKDCQGPNLVEAPTMTFREKAAFWRQFVFLLGRGGKGLIRNHSLITVRLLDAIFTGVVLGLVFLDANQYPVSVQIRNKSGALFVIASDCFITASAQVLAIFALEKPVFYREYRGGYYTVTAYYLSKTLVETPGQVIGPFLLILICYYMIGFSPAFSDYLMVATLASLAGLCGNSFGILMVALADELNVALAIIPVFTLPLMAISGVFVAALPVFINWIKYISPIYYAYSGMLETEFSRDFPNCNPQVEVCDGSRAIGELNFTDTFSSGIDIVFLCTIFIVLWVSGYLVLLFRVRRQV